MIDFLNRLWYNTRGVRYWFFWLFSEREYMKFFMILVAAIVAMFSFVGCGPVYVRSTTTVYINNAPSVPVHRVITTTTSQGGVIYYGAGGGSPGPYYQQRYWVDGLAEKVVWNQSATSPEVALFL